MTIFSTLWVLTTLVTLSASTAFAVDVDTRSRQLAMLGYDEVEINAILKGKKRRSDMDRTLKLKLLGYGPDEVAAALHRPAKAAANNRRQLDIHRHYRPLVQRMAKRYGVEPSLVMAVIQAESNFDTKAVSPASAGGLMQLMPGTAADLGVRNRFDPVQNISAGTRYLAACLKRFGDIRLALAAYNAGPNRVDRLKGIPNNPQTLEFIRRVLKYRASFSAMEASRTRSDAP